jgi:hypothetical protein
MTKDSKLEKAACDDWTKIPVHCAECGVQFLRKVRHQKYCDEHRHLAGAVIRPQEAVTSNEQFKQVPMCVKDGWKLAEIHLDEYGSMPERRGQLYIGRCFFDVAAARVLRDYLNQALPDETSACPKCDAVRKLGLTSCFEHKQPENGKPEHE